MNNINLILSSGTDLISKAKIIFSLNTVTINTVKVEKIEDNEEYLNIRETIIHVKINKKLNGMEKTNSIPKYVATPFPPLKFNQTGNTWPKKTINAAICICSGIILLAIITGTYPFRQSRTRVDKAKYLFPVLSTFVAPIFFDPVSLMSLFKKVFVKISPNGIEPDIYERRKTENISNVTVS